MCMGDIGETISLDGLSILPTDGASVSVDSGDYSPDDCGSSLLLDN